ncbi:IPExxxVDY family protein [Pontibacter sp. CAU 1760]
MHTFQLNIEYDYDFDVYGVASSVKEYKLAWALNRLLGLRLTKKQDLQYNLEEQEHMVISNYEYITDYYAVRLLKNKALGMKSFLLPELKEYDYVLQITGALQQLYPQEFINTLLRIPLIRYAKQFDPLTLKLKENLIF